MNYQNIYNSLIEKAKSRPAIQPKERHHIIPRCMGGNDDAVNLIDLTPEEHYTAHLLLVKIYPNNHKLIYAANMMTVGGGRMNNRKYGWLKRKMYMILSQRVSPTKGRSPWNKGKTTSEETKKKQSIAKQGVTPPDCTGRINSKNHNDKISIAKSGKKRIKLLCIHCNKEIAAGNYTRWHGNNCKKMQDK